MNKLSITLMLWLGASCPAFANMLLIETQGASPNRINYYIKEQSQDNTILTGNPFGPVALKKTEMVVVYEAQDKPYWSDMELDFKCPNPMEQGWKKQNKPFKLPDVSSVEFRMASGRETRKGDYTIYNLQPTDWQAATSRIMLRAWRVACDPESVMRARDSATQGDQFNQMEFTRQMALLDLEGVVMLSDADSSWMTVADMTWDKLWTDVTKPSFPKGRLLTKEEKDALQQQAADIKKKMGENLAIVEGNLNALKQKMGFQDAALKLRGKRKISKTERSMLYVWEAKTESDVVAAMGPPVFNDAGGMRFLSYGMEYDNRVVMTRVYTGERWTEGVYKNCNVQFILIPDGERMLRVADIRVSSFKDGTGYGPDVCANLLQVPNG